jgi:hypothetical protein
MFGLMLWWIISQLLVEVVMTSQSLKIFGSQKILQFSKLLEKIIYDHSQQCGKQC